MEPWEIKLSIEEGSSRDYSEVPYMGQNGFTKLGEAWSHITNRMVAVERYRQILGRRVAEENKSAGYTQDHVIQKHDSDEEEEKDTRTTGTSHRGTGSMR